MRYHKKHDHAVNEHTITGITRCHPNGT